MGLIPALDAQTSGQPNPTGESTPRQCPGDQLPSRSPGHLGLREQTATLASAYQQALQPCEAQFAGECCVEPRGQPVRFHPLYQTYLFSS